MGNVAESPVYDAGIYQLEVDDPVLGGPDGVDNYQAKGLANRTAWLKARAMASLRMESIKPVTGAYTMIADDIGRVVSIHDPSATSINLPDLATFPHNCPVTIVVKEISSAVVPMAGNGADIIENYLNSGDGVNIYNLVPGTRVVLVATETSWVVVLRTVPQVPVAGFQPGDISFSAAPALLKDGFFLCDGSLKLRADYPALFAAIGDTYGAGDGVTTFALPDHRDYFPRMWNGGGGVSDLGRVFGEPQDDQFQGHTFGYADGSKLDRGDDGFGSDNVVLPNVKKAEYKKGAAILERPQIVTDDNGHGAPRVGNETRGRNIGVNTFIKY